MPWIFCRANRALHSRWRSRRTRSMLAIFGRARQQLSAVESAKFCFSIEVRTTFGADTIFFCLLDVFGSWRILFFSHGEIIRARPLSRALSVSRQQGVRLPLARAWWPKCISTCLFKMFQLTSRQLDRAGKTNYSRAIRFHINEREGTDMARRINE
jgi:hypothetical protein